MPEATPVDRTVVQLIDTGGPGGAETVFSVVTAELAEAGWRTVPIVPEPGWLKDRLESDGFEVVVEPNHGSFNLGYLRRLVRIIRDSGADLVHAHLLASSVYGSAAAAIAGVPAVCTFHGTVDLDDGSLLDRAKFRLLERASNRVVFVSESLRRRLVGRMGLTRARTEVIPNGIDVSRFQVSGDGSFRRDLGVRPEEILVGAVGNVRPAKDYGVFLRAAARLREQDDRYRFVVVGEHENRLFEDLVALRDDLGLDEVFHFTGLRDDVPRVLADLDVFVLSSSSEGFSLSTVEGMAAGLPVVATRCGGPEAIIADGVDGLLVPPGSPESLAGAVDRVVRDPQLARGLAASARTKADREYSVDRMVSRYQRLYEDCQVVEDGGETV